MGYITPAFSGPQSKGPKSEMATSPLPSWGPKGGQSGYITTAFSGVPKAWGQELSYHNKSKESKKPLNARSGP